MPVISATRCDRRSCSSVCPETPACRWTIDTSQRERSAPATTPAALISRTHTAPNRTPNTSGSGGHQQVDATKQPAVPDAHLATPRREPQEHQATDRPLQQNRGGVETDHAGQANDPMHSEGSPTRVMESKMFSIAKPFCYRGVSILYNSTQWAVS